MGFQPPVLSWVSEGGSAGLGVGFAFGAAAGFGLADVLAGVALLLVPELVAVPVTGR